MLTMSTFNAVTRAWTLCRPSPSCPSSPCHRRRPPPAKRRPTPSLSAPLHIPTDPTPARAHFGVAGSLCGIVIVHNNAARRVELHVARLRHGRRAPHLSIASNRRRKPSCCAETRHDVQPGSTKQSGTAPSVFRGRYSMPAIIFAVARVTVPVPNISHTSTFHRAVDTLSIRRPARDVGAAPESRSVTSASCSGTTRPSQRRIKARVYAHYEH